ncbi:hypothetical protein SAY87_001231 [Trapa incisa]|uniref:Uncharacterized protein n=1 Tax=Trapa incisa TaxID=236973 RepID=A0AAN7JHH7_9MYRT|nr:hypothetical protein SAY87_001231 [Trapa incisa]
MGGFRSRPVFVGLILSMVLGFAIYFRLWTIDYSISSSEAEMLRKEFDLAHREAMDESAEWRRQYDNEHERASNCERELTEVRKKGSSGEFNVKFEALQKENAALLKKLEILNNELNAEKLKCR